MSTYLDKEPISAIEAVLVNCKVTQSQLGIDSVNDASLAKEQGLHLTRRNNPDAKWHVGLTFNQPTNHRRDMDGMLGSFKAGLDGLADSMGVDDHKFELSLKTGAVIKGGSVIAQIEVKL